jgi:uncharacterized protein (TIGR02271 family)
MAKTNPPVHVSLRDDEWAVVREGNDRATSFHPTQAEAAKAGREIARRDQTGFLLHGRDGRIRERSDYGKHHKDSHSSIEDSTSHTAEAADEVAMAANDAVGQVTGAAGQMVGRLGQTTNAAWDGGTFDERTEDREEEVSGLTGEKRDEGFGTPEEWYAGYDVYDEGNERIGKVDELFLDENDRPEYIGVKIGLFGTRSALIPTDIVTIDDERRSLVVSRPKSVVEEGPSLGGDEELTPELEQLVRVHYGLPSERGAEDRGDYGAYYRDDHDEERSERGRRGSGAKTGPAETGGLRDWEGPLEPEGDVEDSDELRMQRSEEELRVVTHEREGGAVRVRKRARTERERIQVPKKHEEVTVERVPVEREPTGVEIGEDEIVVPVIEEEVVVEKRPVVKEEIRIRKHVIEDEEIVEEDVRCEEVEVVDETERGAGPYTAPERGGSQSG